MHSPAFSRRKTFLGVQAALAALALSMPVMATDVSISDSDPSAITTNRICLDSTSGSVTSCASGTKDPLNPTGSTEGAIVPISSGQPVGTNNNVEISSWTNSQSADKSSVAGGGSFEGGTVQSNTLTLKNNSAIGGKAVGGAVTTDGTHASGTAKNNTVNIEAGSSTGADVIGGLAQGASADHEVKAEGNTVNFSGKAGASGESAVYGGWAGITGATGSATAERNTVKVDGASNTTAPSAGHIVGGAVYNNEGSSFTGTATAQNNEVIITNVAESLNAAFRVRGGQVYDEGNTQAQATGNKVYIGGRNPDTTGGASFKGNVYGGYINDKGNATGNIVEIRNSSAVEGVPIASTPGGVVGGSVAGDEGDVSKNKVVIGTEDSTTDTSSVTGLVVGGAIEAAGNTAGKVGGASGDGNIVILNSGTVKASSAFQNDSGNLIGGLSIGDGEISYNEAIINGGVVEGHAVGGWAGNVGSDVANGAVTNNKVFLHNTGEVKGVLSGGISQTGNANENQATISGGKVGGHVYGGYVQGQTATGTGAAQTNHVTIDNTVTNGADIEIGSKVFGGRVGANSTGTAEHNRVTIKNKDGSSLAIKNSVHGGATSGTGDAIDNHVTITGGATIDGVAESGISGGVIGGLAAGAGGSVTKNTVTIGADASDTTEITGLVVGGAIQNASNSGTVGGSSGDGNTVTLKGGKVKKHSGGADAAVGGDVIGGLSVGSGAVSYNEVNIEGGTVERDVGGGWAAGNSSADVTHNSVTVSGGTVGRNVLGGVSQTGNANENTVTVTGDATVTSNVYGGYAQATTGGGNATGNVVTLGGTAQVKGNVYGGQTGTSGKDAFTDNSLEKISAASRIVGTAKHFAKLVFGYSGNANIGTLDTTPSGGSEAGVTLDTGSHDVNFDGDITGSGGLTKTGAGALTLDSGSYSYSGATTVDEGTFELVGTLTNSSVTVNAEAVLALRGGTASKDVEVKADATLNAYENSHIGGKLEAANANLNFYLPATFTSGTLLSVTGAATITDSTVGIGVLGASSPLKAGDSLTLIRASSVTGSPENNAASGQLLYNATLFYDFDLATTSDSLTATVRGGPRAIQQAKALPEGFLAGTAFLNQGADFLASRGLSAALASRPASGVGFTGFAAIGGGSLKHETGSHVDVDGYTFVAGAAIAQSLSVGELTLGAFIEHGEGDYDTYNSFANAASVHGSGDTDYTGGGLLAHLKFADTARGHLYTEASARVGKVSLEFTARELRDSLGQSAAYDSDTFYASAHAGLGYVLNLNERSSLKLYGQYLWSHQGADTVVLTTSEPVKFRAVDSQRTRLGARWNHAVSQSGNAYLGAAWEHEFDGKARASIFGARIATPDLKGDTGVVEAGFTLTPGARQPLTLDVGVQGYTGKREGVTGSLKVNYRF
jgi:hypothetical protein